MTILLVNEHLDELDQLSGMIKKIRPDLDILCFSSSLEALAEARKTEIDIAVISAEMAELGGLDLGKYLTDLYPMVNLIFLSDSKEYGYDAINIHASGYVLRPLSQKAVRREMEDLRYPEIQKNAKRVFAHTFGNFELFVDGKPVEFKYSRTKEIVALLVNNNGAQTSNGEIIASLWEDEGDPKKKASYLCNLRQDLQNTFNRLKLKGIIIKQRGSMAIAKDRIECDLYDWMEKKEKSKYSYLGDYMNQYSWAEYKHAMLDELSYEMYDE